MARTIKTGKPSKVGKRIGGKGCPSCGSHDTDRLTWQGAQWCNTCGHKWVPCDTPHCRGFEIDITGDAPAIRGCRGCGVPDRIARWWPEAYRAIYVQLAELKMKSVVD